MELPPRVTVQHEVVEGPREPEHRLRQQPFPLLRGDLRPGLVEGVQLDVDAAGGAIGGVLQLGEPTLHEFHRVGTALVVDAHVLDRGGEGEGTQDRATLEREPDQTAAPRENNLTAADVADLDLPEQGTVQLDDARGGSLLAPRELGRFAHAFDRLDAGQVEVGEEGERPHDGRHVRPALGGRAPTVPGEGEAGEVDWEPEDAGLEGARVGVEGEGGELREPLHKVVVDPVLDEIERRQEELGVVHIVPDAEGLEAREPDVVAEEEHEELLHHDDGGESEVAEGGPAQGTQLRHHHGARRLLRGGRLEPHGAGEVQATQAGVTPETTDVAELVETPHAQTQGLQVGGGG